MTEQAQQDRLAGGGGRYVSMPEAALYLGCGERTIRRYIAAGRLRGYRLGNRVIRVDRNELDALLRPITTV